MKIVKITILMMAIAILFKVPMIVSVFGFVYAVVYIVGSMASVVLCVGKLTGHDIKSSWVHILAVQGVIVFWPVLMPIVFIFRKGK